MTSFLHNVAKHLLGKYGQDLAHVAVVFPNKRAALFLNQSLAQLSDGPIWSPSYITISDLFREHSDLTVADPILTIAELHKSYTSITGSDEPFEQFYPWGQLLLSDFDDLDKNLADAKMVFRNLRDYREYDDVEFLTEEQKALLKRFFNHFTDNNSQLQRRFLDLWSRLYDIYTDFRQRLRNQGLAYEGMLYRDVASCEDIKYEYDHYVFVGFNMVHPVEQKLFHSLQKQGKAAFYWDFDHWYLQSEASLFIRKYLKLFPNEFNNDDKELYDNLTSHKAITFMAAPTESIQAHYVTEWLRENNRMEAGNRTAIVMCNERLLPTIVHCIPPEVGPYNVTTGFSLSETPVSSLVEQLLLFRDNAFVKRQNAYRLHEINLVLRHPYATLLSPLVPELIVQLNEQRRFYVAEEDLCLDDGLTLLFSHEKQEDELSWLITIVKRIAQSTPVDPQASPLPSPLMTESLFRMYTLLNRLHALSNEEIKDIVSEKSRNTLLRQLIAATTIPFHGEPAEGIQVMGVLETRNLDFDHLLILSCNDGNMPKGVNDTSFIPHTLRKAFGLTTIENKVAIYSYYFHRLIQRAGDITILYNNSTEGFATGEMSRFMLQMMVGLPQKINRQLLQAGQTPLPHYPDTIEKTDAVMERLRSMLLSPTAINKYIDCPLRFYYNYAAKLYDNNDGDEDIVDSRIFGLIFHRAAQLVYEKLLPQGIIHAEDIEKILNDRTKPLDSIIAQAFSEELFNLPKGTVHHPQLNGMQLITREAVMTYLRRLLSIDKRIAPFRVIGHELDTRQTIFLDDNTSVDIGGRIDRLDEVGIGTPDHRLRVVDYKTGSSVVDNIGDVKQLFEPPTNKIHTHGYALQTMLYADSVSRDIKLRQDYPIIAQIERDGPLPVQPTLLFILKAGNRDYQPDLLLNKESVTDIRRQVSDELHEHLAELLHDIFNISQPFRPTDDINRCKYCPFTRLCGR
jgi:hypothetical protein